MEHKNTALAPAVMEIINQVSGTYSAPFWDGLLAVTESLDTVRAAKDAIEALHGEKKDAEAYRLILVLHDLAWRTVLPPRWSGFTVWRTRPGRI